MVKKNTYPPHVLEIPEPKIKKDSLKEWWNKIMHKQFHIGWVFGVLIIGIVICILSLIKLTQ
jgi:hypothetical protein